MQAVNPAYWWALSAVALPILLHLHNRNKGKIKILGHIAWLKEVQPAQSNLRKIYQWPLLIIRMLLIITIVLLLVDLSFKKYDKPSKLKTLILVHPSSADTLHIRQLAEKWQNDSVQVRWLMPGYPHMNNNEPKVNDPEIWSLISEADKTFKADSIHIIAPGRSDFFSGKKYSLSTPLSFELTTFKKDTFQLLYASLKENEPELFWFESNSEKTEFKLKPILSGSNPGFPEAKWLKNENSINVKSKNVNYNIPITNIDTLRIGVVLNKNLEKEYRILKTAFSAISDYNHVPILFTEDLKNADWLFTFNNTDYPVQNDFDLIWKYNPVQSVNWLEHSDKNYIIIKKKLETGNVLKGGLLSEIRPYLLEFKYRHVHKPWLDYRKLDIIKSGNAHSKKSDLKNDSKISTITNYRIWFGMLALALLLLERLWPKKI